MRRGAVLAAVVVVVLLGWPAARPAQAHSSLVSSSPAAGSTVTASPAEVTLTFAQPIRARLGAVVITGPDGPRYTLGEARAIDKTVHQPLRPLRSGTYRVAWRVVTVDGHTIQGAIRFTANIPVVLPPSAQPSATGRPSTPAAPASAASTAAESTDDATAATADSGTPWAWAAAAGAAALAVVLVVGLRLRSRRKQPGHPGS